MWWRRVNLLIIENYYLFIIELDPIQTFFINYIILNNNVYIMTSAYLVPDWKCIKRCFTTSNRVFYFTVPLLILSNAAF